MPDEKIADLIERVERASGPDRELDCDLFWLLEHDAAQRAFNNAALGKPKAHPATLPIPGGLGRTNVRAVAPIYTASLDAVLSLVERVRPGWVWNISKIDGVPTRAPLKDCEARLWIPSVRTQRLAKEAADGQGDTPPLAILSALLRSITR